MYSKFGNNIFHLGGLEQVTDPKRSAAKGNYWKEWTPERDEQDPAQRWLDGRTGIPFIDANMAELKSTGYMSNRGRQNVASFLAKDLEYDWRIGAEFFESHLLDHEVCSLSLSLFTRSKLVDVGFFVSSFSAS